MSPKVANPPWQRDELILALDIYFRYNPNKINKQHNEVINLSNILNSLPIHSDRPDAQKFRNPNGVYMKLCNFLRFDKTYQGKGLQRGGKLEEEIWNEFANDPERLHKVAQSIIFGTQISKQVEVTVDNEEENEFPEGKVLYRLHKSRERNRKLIKKTKDKALKKGNLKCAVCKFDFHETYGELGEGYIECHHTIPVSEYKSEMVTKVNDLALVCSNCHRMLHRKRPWLTIDQLSLLLNK